jgi:alkanesulfonate monooxygenase SsuD/methylene tetrahydromethanopterin reductase-like flavin-dependent oxidoreductase (luciferase family)
MRFGVQFGVYAAGRDPAEELKDITERARLAARCNFEALFYGQHYLNGPGSAAFQSLPMLAYLAGQAPGLYLGTSIFLLPLHPPVMAAEYVATLDILSRGKFLFGIGQGYRDIEFESFGVPKRQRRQRLVEAVEIIRRLWSEDGVSFRGEVFQLNGVSIAPKPLQRPGPPILMGADTVQSVSRVPEVADHWIASRRHSKNFLREAVPAYKSALEHRGKEFKGLFIFRDLCLARTQAEAERRVRTAYERKYREYHREGQPGERYDLPFEDLKEGRLIMGTPEQAFEEILAYHEEFGAEFMWFIMNWPDFEPQWALETIQMFGEEVIPKIKRATPVSALP